MLQLMLANQNLPFSIALALMVMIALLEGSAALFGSGISSAIDSLLPETDLNPHTEVSNPDADGALSRLLGWLRIGEVPILMLLIIWLLSFSLTGLLLQGFIQGLFGILLPSIVAVIIAFGISMPCVRFFGGLLQKIMPKDETSAVTSDSLLGRIAIVTQGIAKHNYAAEARVMDQHGYNHYIQLEPDQMQDEFSQGCEVLLLSRQGAVYRGIKNPNPYLAD